MSSGISAQIRPIVNSVLPSRYVGSAKDSEISEVATHPSELQARSKQVIAAMSVDDFVRLTSYRLST